MHRPPITTQDSSRDRADLRASDRDRERVLEELRVAAAEGRLDAEEHERRADAALAAATVGDLAQLTRDLPRSRRRADGEDRPWWGRRVMATAAGSGYLMVGALLLGIWALTGGGYFWPMWPLLGWGIPMTARALRGGGWGGPCHRAARPHDTYV